MEDQSKKLNSLLQKLELLLQKQDSFQSELNELRSELNALKIESPSKEEKKAEIPTPPDITNLPELDSSQVIEFEKPRPPISSTFTPVPEITSKIKSKTEAEAPQKLEAKPKESFFSQFKTNSDVEKFLGESLASKVGIFITILGVGIGAKYAIDNDLISPLTRIILGYLMGIGLLGFAMKLKEKYKKFSAVLLSGGMTILYFITYFGYDLYGLIPQMVAFPIMVIFTGFTVFAALKYDEQIIAGLGLVGAYAVPFLLSNNSGNVLFLFSYMTLINAGILVIAFRRNWKTIYNLAFYFTWLIFGGWLVTDYSQSKHFNIALIFSTLFFIIFYLNSIAYKVQQNEALNFKNVLIILLNSAIYFSLGYGILDDHKLGQEFLGAFSIFNGFLHFAVCRYIYKKDLVDKTLFYLIAGLVFTFLTIAVPIQLDGSWVTMIWALEAALLFWIGRTKSVAFYEKLSFALMVLGSLSLLQDWSIWTPDFYYSEYAVENAVTPFFNNHFLTGIVFLLAFGFIQKIAIDKKYVNPFEEGNSLFNLHKFFIPTLLIIGTHNTFWIEISTYFQNAYFNSAIPNAASSFSPILNESILLFKNIWTMNFSLVFLTILTFLNFTKIKNQVAGQLNFFINLLAILIFMLSGLFLISEIREIYLLDVQGEFYNHGMQFQFIRYISLIVLGLLAYSTIKLSKTDFMDLNSPKTVEVVLYGLAIWLLSSELLHWMDILGMKNSYKLALSILWGIFALFGIWIGIFKHKQHLRIAAIALFGLTLLKLFFYDIAHLDTISKTIVLVSLGVLLLIISFLYNKFKPVVSDDSE